MVLLGIFRRFLPVHDVSTDYEDPPKFLKGKQSHPQLVPLLKIFYADVQPLTVDTSDTAAVYAAALDAAKAMPQWDILTEDPGSSGNAAADARSSSTNGSSSRSFQAVATTKLMRFKDDIVVRVAATGSRVVVDVRSRSRVGQGDIGANGNRILQYQHKLKAALAARQLLNS